jgi:hypothetical protein
MQLELFPFEKLTSAELMTIHNLIRNSYWHIRNLRKSAFGQARRRFEYRKVAEQKKRLLMAGVSKREVLDFLACCRLKCRARKHPFEPCPYCLPRRFAPTPNFA